MGVQECKSLYQRYDLRVISQDSWMRYRQSSGDLGLERYRNLRLGLTKLLLEVMERFQFALTRFRSAQTSGHSFKDRPNMLGPFFNMKCQHTAFVFVVN